jgi:hypothetical protein
MFGAGKFLKESVFLSWIAPHLEVIDVNKDCDFSA